MNWPSLIVPMRIGLGALVMAIVLFQPAASPIAQAADTDAWTVPDTDLLPNDARGKLIRLGRELTAMTYAHLGPEAAKPEDRYAGNNLACENCHLQAGAKRFGLPFIGVYPDFPQYRAREGRVGTIEDRINGCMTRSMNGRPLPDDSLQMRAFVAYVQFLSDGSQVPGRGSGKLPELSRPADPKLGEAIYQQTCAQCHGVDGMGKRRAGAAAGYEFPPLWGPDSFNDGAGMNRLISAANFIHSNMPNGIDWTTPVLSTDDSWDVAAFLVSKPRPHKEDLDQDFPKRTEKSVDASYGPFADGLSTAQHEFGPFDPIRTKLKELKAAQSIDSKTSKQ